MNKLKINTASAIDLASRSLAVLPPACQGGSRANVPRFECRSRHSGRSEPSCFGTKQYNSKPLQPLMYSGSQSSQQSFSQGVTQSQNTQLLTQNSQDDPPIVYEQWKCNREGTLNRSADCIAPHACQNLLLNRDDRSRLALAPASTTASNLLQRINTHAWRADTNCHLSQELDQRLGSLDAGMNRVLPVLESVHQDLKQLVNAVKEASIESEGIKQKLLVQESCIRLLLKEEEEIKSALSAIVNYLPERKEENANISILESLADELKRIPASMRDHLATIKSELFSLAKSELQESLNKSQLRLERPELVKSDHRLREAALTDSYTNQRKDQNHAHRNIHEEAGAQRMNFVKTELVEEPFQTIADQQATSALTIEAKPMRTVTPFTQETPLSIFEPSMPVTSDNAGWIEKKSSCKHPRSKRNVTWQRTTSCLGYTKEQDGYKTSTAPVKGELMAVDQEHEDSFLFFGSYEINDARDILRASNRCMEDPFEGPKSEQEARRIRDKMLRARKKRSRLS